jgi:ABC-2 type transport system ATP-binding protein
MKNLTMKLKNISKVYGKKYAVKNIDLESNGGQILAILGPNGAGKTTLIKIISDFLIPTTGEVELVNVEKTVKKIGVSFGGSSGFYNEVSAKDNLVFYSHLDKIKRRNIKEEVTRVLKIVGLENEASKKVGEMSLGMKQRLHIAKALLGNPPILLLDEPTNGVDVDIARDIRNHILGLKSEGKIIIITSHIMKDIERLADKIVLLNKGEIIYQGDITGLSALVKKDKTKELSSLEEVYLNIYDNLGDQSENN